MWLLNATTEEQRQGISEYFDPTLWKFPVRLAVLGGVMGGLTVSKVGSRVTDVQPIVHNENPPLNVKMQIDPERLEKEQLQQELQNAKTLNSSKSKKK